MFFLSGPSLVRLQKSVCLQVRNLLRSTAATLLHAATAHTAIRHTNSERRERNDIAPTSDSSGGARVTRVCVCVWCPAASSEARRGWVRPLRPRRIDRFGSGRSCTWVRRAERRGGTRRGAREKKNERDSWFQSAGVLFDFMMLTKRTVAVVGLVASLCCPTRAAFPFVIATPVAMSDTVLHSVTMSVRAGRECTCVLHASSSGVSCSRGCL